MWKSFLEGNNQGSLVSNLLRRLGNKTTRGQVARALCGKTHTAWLTRNVGFECLLGGAPSKDICAWGEAWIDSESHLLVGCSCVKGIRDGLNRNLSKMGLANVSMELLIGWFRDGLKSSKTVRAFGLVCQALERMSGMREGKLQETCRGTFQHTRNWRVKKTNKDSGGGECG